MKKIIFGVLLLLCSCEELATDGIVNKVEQSTSFNYNFKVQVKKNNSLSEIYGGSYYWFLTNDTLLVGDTIRISKVE